MASGGGRQQAGNGSNLRNNGPKDFVPSFAWSEDSSCHYLLVDLPGFKKEQLKLHVDEHGNVFVSGEKQGRENKTIHFEQSYKVPENSELENITARYEGEVLYIVVPKKVKEPEIEQKTETEEVASPKKELQEVVKEEEEHKHEVASPKKELQEVVKKEEEHRHETANRDKNMTAWTRQTWIQEAGMLGSVVNVLSKNKGIVATAVLAFSLGVLVSQRFHSGVGTEVSVP